MLSSIIRLAITGGAVVAAPVFLIGASRLFIPVLDRKDRRFAVAFVSAVMVSYAIGATFAYFVLLPIGLRFLLSFGTDIATPTIRIADYLALSSSMLFWLGLVFEVPLFMFLLAKLQVVSHRRWNQLHRQTIIAASIFGMIITPGFDPLAMMLVAVPLVVLYEVGVFLAWLARPKVPGRPHPKWRRLGKVIVWLACALLLPTLLVGVVAGLLWWAGVLEVDMHGVL
jgi:sec-independent protein translocase protein TatC